MTAHEIAVAGTTIAWDELGEGPPVVLLHGLMDSRRTWRRSAPILARRFRVLMPDLAGHGLSGRPDAPYTLAWHAGVIAQWMGAIGVGRAHLCGHSYGAGIAQWMLLDERERVDRLALVSAGGLGREVGLGLRLVAFPVLGPMLTPIALRYAVPVVLKRTTALYGHMEPDEVADFLRMNRIPGTDRAFIRSLQGVINLTGQYMQTAQRVCEAIDPPPIAIFWGTNDPVIPVRHGRNAVANAEGITLTTYEDCGHYPHLDAPYAFARDLTAFLDDPARRPARFRRTPRGWRLWDRFAHPGRRNETGPVWCPEPSMTTVDHGRNAPIAMRAELGAIAGD